MTYRKKVDAQLAHINSLRLVIGLLIILGLYMAYGWQSAPRDLTIHVPPDLRSGSTRQWWDIPPESVYAFGLYLPASVPGRQGGCQRHHNGLPGNPWPWSSRVVVAGSREPDRSKGRSP